MSIPEVEVKGLQRAVDRLQRDIDGQPPLALTLVDRHSLYVLINSARTHMLPRKLLAKKWVTFGVIKAPGNQDGVQIAVECVFDSPEQVSHAPKHACWLTFEWMDDRHSWTLNEYIDTAAKEQGR